MRRLLLLATFVCGGCPGPEAAPQRCPIGDLTQAAEIEILCQDAFQNVARVSSAMAEVPLVGAEQGGQVLLLGVRARNLDGCQLTMTASLRDPCTDELLVVEQRPVVLDPTSDGWGEPRADTRADWANLPLCPNVAASRDLQGQGYVLRIKVEDGDGKTAEVSLPIVPTCPASAEGGDGCLCQCQAGYVLGDECPAGLSPGTPVECPAP